VGNNIRRENLRSMKSKFYKLIGIALTVVLLASLTVGLAGVPAGADSSNLKFTKLDLPQVENYDLPAPAPPWVSGGPIGHVEFAASEGDYWATPEVDLGPIAMSPDGGVLFAGVNDDSGTFYEVLKSLDGGYSWTVTGFYAASFGAGDNTPIVDIVTSPEYGDDTTLLVATMAFVYISDDGGKNFVQLAPAWGGNIADLDVTVTDDEDLAIMVAAPDGFGNGEIFVKKGLLAWVPQNLAAAYTPNTALAGAFLPTFADDGNIGICAVINDNAVHLTTVMTFSFNDINVPGPLGGWNTSGIADAPFAQADSVAFYSDYARVAFPDDFDAFGIGTNVCFAGIVSTAGFGALTLIETDGSDAYKVILKEAGTSTAVDLDVRGVITTLLPTATAITSIDVCGNAEEATILVGTDACNLADTPVYFFTYHSEDSGESWMYSFKQPSGGDEELLDLKYEDARTQVLMAPDFCEGGTAYAATRDSTVDIGPIGTSAFQRTTDGAASWNQISIIDYAWIGGDYYVTPYGFSASGYIADGTLRMITSQAPIAMPPFGTTFGTLWERTDGKHWEGILSYATPGITDGLFQIAAPADGSALFAVDMDFAGAGNDCMWRSTDGGATWPKKINTKGGLQWVTAVSATTLYTTHVAPLANFNGLWWTTKSGTGWSKPDDSEIPNAATVVSASVMGDVVICSTYDGDAFISSDGGETVEKVGKNTPGVNFGPPSVVTADLGFAGNGMLYLVSMAVPGHGVWRTSVDLGNPGACKWERIDNNQTSTDNVGVLANYYPANTFVAASPAIALPPSGILYVVDGAAVDTTVPAGLTGGLWRCTNPTADLDSITPPYFERENKGLTGDGAAIVIPVDDTIGLKSLDLAPPTLAPTFFCNNNTPANYWEQMVMFTDILNVGVPLVMPEADASGVGLLPENMVGDVYPVVTFAWEEMAGATGYQYQVSIDPGFKTKVLSVFTNDLGAIVDGWLLSNATYYWRVRVADQGSLIGAPLISPWSETYKFKTAIGPTMQRPALQAPVNGEFDIPLSPTFEWSGIEWAEVYEYELGLDPTTTAGGYFAEPLVALIGTNSLVSTAWKCDTTLDYETRYYWHVKAIGVDTDTPWSDVGTFTTMGVPPTTPTPVPPVEIPPAQNITPAWIWAIVIIGAILVIAVVVLIVTTRRVP